MERIVIKQSSSSFFMDSGDSSTRALIAKELLRIIEEDDCLNELAFCAKWETYEDILGRNYDRTKVMEIDRDVNEFVCVSENKMALNYECLVDLLKHVYEEIRRNENKKEKIVVLLCLLCGDSLTGWNARKRSVIIMKDENDNENNNNKREHVDESTLKKELQFAEFVLTKWPKSTAAFAHRRWAFRKHFLPIECDDEDEERKKMSFYEREIKVCEETSRMKPSNYASWTHRLFALETLLLSSSKNALVNIERAKDVLQKLEKTISASDPSAWHFRRAVIQSIGNRVNDCDVCKERFVSLARDEFRVLREKIAAYRGRESLWHHRKTMFAYVKKHSHQYADFIDIITEEREFANRKVVQLNNENEAQKNTEWATYADADEAKFAHRYCVSISINISSSH